MKNGSLFDPGTGGTKPVAPVVGLTSGAAVAGTVTETTDLAGAIKLDSGTVLADSGSSEESNAVEQDRLFIEFDFENDFNSLSN